MAFYCVNPVEFHTSFLTEIRKEQIQIPKSKTQGIIFGIIMSYAMAYGMEVYNIAIREGINLTAGGFSNMTNIIFRDALVETLYMGVLVILFSSLWGNRVGAAFAAAPFTHWIFGKIFPDHQ